MKSQVRLILLTITLALSLLSLFQLILGDRKQLVLPLQIQITNKISPGLPVHLAIPKINVNASIQQVGVTPKGEMDVPNNAIDVGWFKLGPRPGEKGSAVIDGHFDNVNGEAAVFFNLYKLKKGDKVYVQDGKGTSVVFAVRESRLYDPGLAGEVFNSSDSAHLNLITCDGVWDGVKKNYTKRLVVFTDIEN